VLLATLLGLTGCPEDEVPFRFHFVMAPQDPACTAPGDMTTDFPVAQYDLRLALLERKAGTAVTAAKIREYDLVCDAVFASKASAQFVVPRRAGRVAVRVEAFSGSELKYSGALEDVDLSASEATIRLRPSSLAGEKVKGVSCVPKLRKRRAFHSATLLPNGRVLIFGGVVADGGEGAAVALPTVEPIGVSATAVIEYYDPTRAEVRVLTPDPPAKAEDQLKPRALHHAFLLSSPADGPYQILVVGGVRPADGKPAFWLRVSRTGYPFLLSPHNAAKPAEAMILTVTPAATTDGEPRVSTRTIASFPATFFPGATLVSPENLALVAGGAGEQKPAYANPEAASPTLNDDRGFLSDPASYFGDLGSEGNPKGQTAFLQKIRAGHAVARLDADRFLVLGGNMNGTIDDVAELITRPTTGAFTVAPLTFTTKAAATAWHTLTSIGGSDGAAPTGVLWAGGFTLANDTSGQRTVDVPRTPPVQWVSAADPTLLKDVDAGAFKSVGYHDAIALHDGSVLLSGGNGDLTGCVAKYLCPQEQRVVFKLPKGGSPTLATGTPSLGIARFGHRTVRLLDNSLLFTGGISRKDRVDAKLDADAAALKDAEALVLLNSVELYNPRSGDPSEDAPLFRDPGKDSADTKGLKDPSPPGRCQLR